MSAICGYFFEQGAPARPGLLDEILQTLNHWRADSQAVWQDETARVGLGRLGLHKKSFDTQEDILSGAGGTLHITADAILDNRSELIRKLALSLEDAEQTPDGRLILLAYQKWGLDCAQHLLGDFAFVIWDASEHRLFCCRDHFGARPFYYSWLDGVFFWATEMKGIFTGLDKKPAINLDWIADALVVLSQDYDSTPYQNLLRLPPAHWMTVSENGLRLQRYWAPDPQAALEMQPPEDYLGAFKEKLVEAVQCRVNNQKPVGAEMSGGLDSSAIVSLAASYARENGIPFAVFSHTAEEGQPNPHTKPADEGAYQAMLCSHARIENVFRLDSGGLGMVDTIKNNLQLHDGPRKRTYGGLNDTILTAAAGFGAHTLLSGYGGDEGVSCQANEYLSELSDRKEVAKIWREFYFQPPADRKIGLAKLMKVSVKSWITPEPESRRTAGDRNSHLARFPIHPDFYDSSGVEERLAAFQGRKQYRSVRASQAHKLSTPHVVERLELCASLAGAQRIDFRYPLLDVRLVNYHLAMPSNLKWHAGYGRYAYRTAIEGIVPPEIQWRDDKSRYTTVPSFPARNRRDYALVKELVESSRNSPAADLINFDLLLQYWEQYAPDSRPESYTRLGIVASALTILLFINQS